MDWVGSTLLLGHRCKKVRPIHTPISGSWSLWSNMLVDKSLGRTFKG
jgi:hypothetical protein